MAVLSASGTTATAPLQARGSEASSNSSSSSHECKISMLWNWYTLDTCFISSDWHVTSAGGFAVSCFGAWGLVMVLEFLRRLTREYDAWLVKKRTLAKETTTSTKKSKEGENKHSKESAFGGGLSSGTASTGAGRGAGGGGGGILGGTSSGGSSNRRGFRPTVSEQAIRATLYAMQVCVAYFVMLLAMSYNGFILLCIFLGAYTGCFASHWIYLGGEDRGSPPDTDGNTVSLAHCCG